MFSVKRIDKHRISEMNILLLKPLFVNSKDVHHVM